MPLTARRRDGETRAQNVRSDRTRQDLIRRLDISEAEARSIIVAALSGVGSMLVAKLS